MNKEQREKFFKAAEATTNEKARYLSRVVGRAQINVGDKITFPAEISENAKTLVIDSMAGTNGRKNVFASLAYSLGEKFNEDDADFISLSRFTGAAIDKDTNERKVCACPVVDLKNSNEDNIKALAGKTLTLKEVEPIETAYGQRSVYTWE